MPLTTQQWTENTTSLFSQLRRRHLKVVSSPTCSLNRVFQLYVFYGCLGQDPDLEDLNYVTIRSVVESFVQLYHLLVLPILPDKSL